MRLRTILCLLLVNAFMSTVTFADIEDTIEKSFQVGDNGTLDVETCMGTIEVQAAGSGQVKITIYRKFDTESKKQMEEILENLTMEFKQSADNVSVLVHYKKDSDSFFGSGRSKLHLRFVVTVPKKYNLDISTSGGSIAVADLLGKVNARTSGGSLTFGQIEGPVMGKTSGGSITLQGCNGNADVRTSGGSIHIGKVAGPVAAFTSGGSISIEKAKGDIVAETSGGGIDVDEVMGSINASTSGGSVQATITQQPAGPCELSTSGGSITVELAADIKLDINAATSGGRVVTEFPVNVQGELSKSRLQATINGGGPALTLRTSGGSIHINKLSKN
jgi:DUF4097 and DUF4098 domain-containing protein YvlB